MALLSFKVNWFDVFLWGEAGGREDVLGPELLKKVEPRKEYNCPAALRWKENK